jgi:hypothetical protein
MEEKKNCLYCNKKLIPLEGKTKLNTKRKFCNKTCSSRYTAAKWHSILKDNPEYKENARVRFYGWYKNNKQRQNRNVLKNYYENKDKWDERSFVDGHKDKIRLFINPICASCKKEPTKMFFHKQWGNVPNIKVEGIDIREELIKKYTKENLIGVCGSMCLQKEKRRLKTNEKNSDRHKS